MNIFFLQKARDKLLRNLYQQAKVLKNKPINYQCRKILTLNFEKENLCEMVAKGVYNICTVRENLEAEKLEERSH